MTQYARFAGFPMLLFVLLLACGAAERSAPVPDGIDEIEGLTVSGLTPRATAVAQAPAEAEPEQVDAAAAAALPPLVMTVRETAGVARRDEIVRSGVPLPRALRVRDAARLAVVDASGSPVPAELRVLARWDAGRAASHAPIQWVLVAFPASVPAKGSATYRLIADGSVANPAPRTRLALTRDGDRFTIDTGAAVFRLGGDAAALFDEVALPGGARLAGGSAMTAQVNGTATRHATTRSVRVEHAGPLSAVVVVEGAYDLPPVGAKEGGGDIGSIRRYVFTAGSPTAIVRHAIQWEGNLACQGCIATDDGKANGVLVGRARDALKLDLEPAGGFEVAAVGAFAEPAVAGRVAAGEEAWVRQLLRPERQAKLRFEARAGGRAAAGAEADGGMLAVAGSRGAVAVALQRMHRYEPQALRLTSDGELAVDLADDTAWLAHHQGMFATFGVAALPRAPQRAELDSGLWAPLNRPLRAWPSPQWLAASKAVDPFPVGPLPKAAKSYDAVVEGILELTLDKIDEHGLAGLMTFGLYPRYWGKWKTVEINTKNPTPSEPWDDLFWGASWADYHNTVATAPIWAMRSGEVEWLDEIGEPGALRSLHTLVIQCGPDENWFYCGQAPVGYGGYRSDFNSSHAYLDNLYLYYWLTGDSVVVDTLQRGGENMRRWLCEPRGKGSVVEPTGPGGPACPPDHRGNPNAGVAGRVAAQWTEAFRFLGLASGDPSFLEDYRGTLARALTTSYVELERNGVRYGIVGGTEPSPEGAVSGQTWVTAFYDVANLHRLALDTGDAPIGKPPLRPERVLAALARTAADLLPRLEGGDGSAGGRWPNQVRYRWQGDRIGGRLVSIEVEKDRDLFGTEKASFAHLLIHAGRAAGDAKLVRLGSDLVEMALGAARGENAPLGKLQGQYLHRIHPAVAELAEAERRSGRKDLENE